MTHWYGGFDPRYAIRVTFRGEFGEEPWEKAVLLYVDTKTE